MTAPEFLYFVEHGDTAVSGQTGRATTLSPYELGLAAVVPAVADGARRRAAGRGCRRQPANDAAIYDTQVARLLADPRARPALDEFFADWMKVEDLPALDAKNSDPDVQDLRRAPTCPTPACARR